MNQFYALQTLDSVTMAAAATNAKDDFLSNMAFWTSTEWWVISYTCQIFVYQKNLLKSADF